MKIKWTRPAQRDLRKAVEYIVEDSPMAAKSMSQRIRHASLMLAEHPGMGRPGRVKGTRELIVPGLPFTLPYREKGGAIEILRVMHTSRKWPNNLPES